MLLPPPRSTLFPYTTLFRSQKQGRVEEARKLLDIGRAAAVVANVPRTWNAALNLAGQMHKEGDRKSTRLNSSHVAISYAVFCLKKKNSEQLRALWSPLPPSC